MSVVSDRHRTAQPSCLRTTASCPTTRCRSWSTRARSTVDNAHPEKTIEGLFGANGWGEMWRNGVYDYLHYHATVHEALGVARGHARVRFGGDRGKALEISAGDVAILPAGTGHQCLSASDDFCVVGAYPPGPQMQVTRPTPENHAKALKTIPEVKLPEHRSGARGKRTAAEVVEAVGRHSGRDATHRTRNLSRFRVWCFRTIPE